MAFAARRGRQSGALVIAFGLLAAGCDLQDRDMYNQPKHKPQDASSFYVDGASARPLVPGTVARSVAPADRSGQGVPAAMMPGASGGFPDDFPTSGAALERRIRRGQERYNIYCAVCHGYSGHGDGMIVQRGFTAPPAFIPIAEDARRSRPRYDREVFLQSAPPSHYFDVISNGLGAMYGYGDRVAPEDRWAIVVYVKALQAAQPPGKIEPSAMPPTGSAVRTGS